MSLLHVMPFADALGTMALLFCLGAGSLYKQPPLRSARQDKAAKEQEPLLTRKEGMV
jgi:cbb3-type cytochrome oxidase subunit 3